MRANTLRNVGLAATWVLPLLCAAAEQAVERVKELPVGFCLAPEMSYIPEVDDWAACRPEAFAADAAQAMADWKKKSPWVSKQLRAELVRALSRWAKEQMQGYARVPPLADVAFKPVRSHEKSRKLVLEGTVDTLPSHSPVVTRWLKVFLLYDKSTRSILRVTITIRGQLLE